MHDLQSLEQKTPLIQKKTLEILAKVDFGRLGGALSCLHLLTALYFQVLRFKERKMIDRLVLSKRQASPVIYACLSFLLAPNEIDELLERKELLPGLFPKEDIFNVISAGSLGMGLSIANGIALAARLSEEEDRLIYCLIGDGEMQEGQIWEALLFASHQNLSRVCLIIDYNKIQMDAFIHTIKEIAPLKEKMESFQWNVKEINGHSYEEILDGFETFRNHALHNRGPTCLIAHTIKGKGIAKLENTARSHYARLNFEEIQEMIRKDVY